MEGYQESEKVLQRRKGKKLGLHKSSGIGVEEAVKNLKGKRLSLY